MSVQITIEGTVRADGTLVLDNKVAMPEGRVLVTVRPALQPAADDPFWSLMGRIWDGRERRRHASVEKKRTEASLKPVRSDLDWDF